MARVKMASVMVNQKGNIPNPVSQVVVAVVQNNPFPERRLSDNKYLDIRASFRQVWDVNNTKIV